MNTASITIAVVGGVRPQLIKIAALQNAINDFNQTAAVQIAATYIHSGQHYDDELSGSLIRELGLHFDYTLSHQDRDPVRMLGSMLVQIYETLGTLSNLPQWVIVFGDATTTLAGALAATRRAIPVVHVEAGVRSGDLRTIEEVHRRVVSHISSVHFCSTRSGVENLKAENITENVYWTGDLSYNFLVDYAHKQPNCIEPFRAGEYILVTIHKPVNLNSDETMVNLVSSLSTYPREVVFITHPRCRQRLIELGLYGTEGISFLDPLPYGKMLSAMQGCAFIVTDSGGIQREAYYLKKRCLVRRNTLGWSGLINAGIHRFVSKDKESIEQGLAWIEKTLNSDEFPRFEDFVREDACDFALRKLVELSTAN